MLKRVYILAAVFCFGGVIQLAIGQEKPSDRVKEIIVEEDIEYAKVGDISLKLDAYYLPTKKKEPRPAIVWIHGGGWRNGSKANGKGRLRQFVVGGGYVGFSVGYRLSDVAIWPAQIHDCKAAIRYIRANAEKYNIDPDKIAVWGSSAGGHLVSLLGTSGDVKELEGELGNTEVSSRVTCVVDFCGPSDFIAFMEQKPALKDAKSSPSLLFGGALPEKVDAAKLASPVTHVSEDDPPFLIVHGTKDPIVPIAQAEAFDAALKKAKVDVTFVKMVEAGHGLGGREIGERIDAFFAKHLLGKDREVSAEPIEVKVKE